MAPKVEDNRTLPAKEATLFRQLVKHYEVGAMGRPAIGPAWMLGVGPHVLAGTGSLRRAGRCECPGARCIGAQPGHRSFWGCHRHVINMWSHCPARPEAAATAEPAPAGGSSHQCMCSRPAHSWGTLGRHLLCEGRRPPPLAGYTLPAQRRL